jgi:hypothetical protein
MTHFVQTVLLAVGALLPIVDPLGGAPIYQRLTAGVDPADRAPLARLAALDSFVLLLAARRDRRRRADAPFRVHPPLHRSADRLERHRCPPLLDL